MAESAVRVRALRREYTTGKGLRKRGPVITALDGVDLDIAVGEVHGLLGPNGAGKTTLCKVLSTVLLPTSGTAEVLGLDVVRDTQEVRRRIGIVFGGERGLYTRLTARQNLAFWGAMYHLPPALLRPRVEELLDRVGLAARADERVEGFSRGMKQRLHLARGLVSDPQVVLLDEPTTGMDPVAARSFRDLVGELRGEGRSLLVTTHDMAEAEAVCDRVTLIDEGRVLATERPATLGGWISRFERVDVRDAPPEVLDEVERIAGVAAVRRRDDGTARIETDAEGAAGVVLGRLVAAGATSVSTSLPSLEEVYLHVIGERGLQVRR